MTTLKREIGLFTLISIGVGGIIGSGIFALPAAMAAVAGPSLVMAILISGIITLFLGIAYAELGAAFPLAGGTYALPRLALGDFGGFLMGWGYFLYLFIGTAAIIDIFVVYLGFYFPGLAVGETLTPVGITVAVALLWIFTIINIFGVKWGGLYSVITTVGKVLPLVAFGLIGIFYFQKGNFEPFMPFGFMGVTLAVTLFFWSYTGFEAIVMTAEEVKKPHRTIPLAMLLSVLFTIVIYTFLAAIFVGMINWGGLGLKVGDWAGIGKFSSSLSSVAQGMNLPFLAALATIGAIIATGGASGSWVLIQGRLPFAMARDKLFWAPLGKIHDKYKTPAASLIFTSVLTTIILIAIPNFPSVALIASVTAVVPYAAAVLAVPILRKTRADVNRPFKLPCQFVITMIGFILSTYLIYWASWPWNVVGSLLMLTGYVAYLFVKKRKFEARRNSWIPVYLFGIMLVAFVGDPTFVFNNFTGYVPKGILKMPCDLIVLAIFAFFIYLWAYRSNIKVKESVQ